MEEVLPIKKESLTTIQKKGKKKRNKKEIFLFNEP